MIRHVVGQSRCGEVLNEVAGKIYQLLREVAKNRRGLTLLDVGCWDGDFSCRCSAALGTNRILGIEIQSGPAQEAMDRGVEVAHIDLENERFPWPDASVDVIVCNQVLEHLKNIWLPMSEIHRVLRSGGHVVLSVPNLASLHNRVLLAIGRQPTSIRVHGPHVRGFTFAEFCSFVEFGGAYEIERRCGAGFYPFPSRLSTPLSALWSGASHTTILLARKASEESAWADYLHAAGRWGTYYGETPGDETDVGGILA